MRSILRNWGMLGILGGALGGTFAACGGLDSRNIVITDEGNGLGGLGGLNGLGGLDGFGGEAPVLGDPPSVVGVVPVDEAEGVESSAKVVIEFSEALDESSITDDSVYVLDGDAKVPGSLAYTNGHVIFTPEEPLSLLTSYTVHVTTGVHDTTDQVLTSAFSSSFVTRDGAWQEESLFRNASVYLRPSKADAQGNVMVAWNEGSDIYAALISPTGEVGEPKLLESLTTGCYAPAVAMGPNGDAVVAWVNNTGQDLPQEIWARRYIDGQWEAAEKHVESVIGTNTPYQEGPFVGVSNDTFTVGWTRLENYSTAVLSYLEFTKATGAGAWATTPFGVDYGNTGSGTRIRLYGVSLDFGPDGGGTIVYTYDTSTTSKTLRSAFFSANTSSWSAGAELRPSENLAVYDDGCCSPVVTRNASGNALVTWPNTDGTSNEINLLASYYDKANGWSVPMTVDKATDNVFVYDGGVVSFGDRFAVTWKQTIQTVFSPLVSIFDVEEGTWSEPKLLSDGETSNYWDGPQVVADAHGNLLAAWSQGGDLDLPPTVYFSRLNHLDGTWAAPASLVQVDQAYTGVQLVGLATGPVYGLLNQAWWDGPDQPYLAVFE